MSLKWLTGESPEMKKNKGKILLICLISLSLVLVPGCSLLPKEADEEVLPTINPPKLSKKPEYVVKTETIEIPIKAVGSVLALKEEQLSFSQDNKRVKQVYVQSGEQVKAGQVIAELDVSEIESQLRIARLERKKDELALKESYQNSEKTDLQLEQEKVDFELKQQKLADLEEAVQGAKLVAPFDGTIFGIYIQKGDTVRAYDTVAVIADLSELTIAVKMNNAEDLKKITLGMEAEIDINSVGKVKGKVSQLPSPKSEGNNDRYNQGKQSITDYLLISVDKMPEGVTRGTMLEAKFIIQRKENAIVIPPSTLRTAGPRSYVQVIDDQGNKKEVDVEVGLQTPTQVEIIKGLSAGQKVVGK